MLRDTMQEIRAQEKVPREWITIILGNNTLQSDEGETCRPYRHLGDQQFDFYVGRGTMDAMFATRSQLMEKQTERRRKNSTCRHTHPNRLPRQEVRILIGGSVAENYLL